MAVLIRNLYSSSELVCFVDVSSCNCDYSFVIGHCAHHFSYSVLTLSHMTVLSHISAEVGDLW